MFSRSIAIGLLIAGICCLSFCLPESQANEAVTPGFSGLPGILNFTPSEFGPHTQHWAIAELPGGELIIGNHGGYNIYDGVSWTRRTIPNYTVASIAICRDGTPYLGGLMEFGYLYPDSIGALSYRSLVHFIPERYRDFSYVRHTYESHGNIYFQAREYLFRWDGRSIYVWEPETSFHFMLEVNKSLYVRQPGFGLYEVKGDSLALIRGGEKFAEIIVPVILPWDIGKLLIGTRTDGFYIYDGYEFKRFTMEAEVYISENQLYHGSILPDGTMVLGTIRGGLIHVDRRGKTLRILTKESGLQDETVYMTYVDRTGKLWLCLNNGLSMIDILSPVTYFNERVGISGLVSSFAYFYDSLYVGTTSGLFLLIQDTENGIPRSYFTAVRGVESYIWNIVRVRSVLLIATNEGLYAFNGMGPARKILDGAARGLALSEDPDIVYASVENEILRLHLTDGEFTVDGRCGRVPWSVFVLMEEFEGRLWVATIGHGVFVLNWDIDPDNAAKMIVTDFNHIQVPYKDDLPQTQLFRLNDQIRVISTAGIWMYDDVRSELIPDTVIACWLSEAGIQAFIAAEDHKGNIWLSSITDSYRLKKKEHGGYEIYEGYLRHLSGGQVYSIYPAGDGTVWYGGSGGVVRYNALSDYNLERQYQTFIRRVTLNSDSLVYAGYGSRGNGDFQFRYKENNLRFQFSLPAFDLPGGNMFQVKLEPIDKNWSRWSNEWYRDYTNLREGRYKFIVRGKDVYGNIGETASFEFRVLPPWYRAAWAYAAFVLLLGGLLFILHKYRVGRILEVERTRMRIARDLHDDIGSHLSSIALMTDIAATRGETGHVEKQELAHISNTAREAIDSLREVVWIISPEHDKLETLTERMKSTAETMLSSIPFSFHDSVNSSNEEVSMDFKRSVLLIYKEALNNIIKHSSAKNVRIDVNESDRNFNLVIQDDGIGFSESGAGEGNGLSNMRYRARQIDGELEIISELNRGTKIKLKAELN